MDDAGIPALTEAIRNLHGLDAEWVGSVPVQQEHAGQIVWSGEVQVFEVSHPLTSRIFAWSHRTDSGKTRFHAVLGMHPLDTPETAVQASILAEAKLVQN
jgi:hypothetical protein